MRRHLEHIRELAEYRPALVDNRSADKVLQKEAALRELRLVPVDRNNLVFEDHRGVYVLHALEQGNQKAIVLAGGDNFSRGPVDIKLFEASEKIRAVGPGFDFDLALDAVRIDDFSRFKIFIHISFSVRDSFRS